MSHVFEFVKPSGGRYLPDGLVFTLEKCSADEKGGMLHAEIAVVGGTDAMEQLAEMLAYRVVIRHRESGMKVWWGHISEALIPQGGILVGMTLDGMCNRARARYTYQGAEGYRSGLTNWVENAESIARYGAHEKIIQTTNTNGDRALEKATATLQLTPVATVRQAQGDDGQGRLVCRGDYDILGRRYYSQPAGYIANKVTPNARALLGWGFTGLCGFSPDGRVHNLDAYFAALDVNDRLQISGSASNNKAVTVEDGPRALEVVRVEGTTIFFDANDDIHDTENGMSVFTNGEMILVSGSSVGGNNKYHLLDSVAGGHCTVDTDWNGTITTSAAGPNVTVKQGNSVLVTESIATELPGASVTVAAHGTKIAWPFTPSVDVDWELGSVIVSLWKVGNPIDDVQLQICLASNSGTPGTVLETVTIAASAITTQENGRTLIPLSGNVLLPFGNTCFGVLQRTGANDPDDYYVVGLSEEEVLAGSVQLWTGSGWAIRTPNASVDYEIWGVRETTAQMADIATYLSDEFARIHVVDRSSKKTTMYRDGDYLAADELEALLAEGTVTGKNLLVTVLEDRTILVQQEPTYNLGISYLVDRSGQLLRSDGTRLLPGELPAGKWATVRGIASSFAQATGASPFILRFVEYDAAAGGWRWEPRNAPTPWDDEFDEG